MAEAGIFAPDDRTELIEGDLAPMTPIGPRHAACVRRLARLLAERVPREILIDIQNPLRIGPISEFYPDIMLLRSTPGQYEHAGPEPLDVLLVIEVADASLERDQAEKLPRYAEAGIPEFWLVDLVRDQILVHRNPTGNRYGDVSSARRGASLTPRSLPHVTILAEEILGPVAQH